MENAEIFLKKNKMNGDVSSEGTRNMLTSRRDRTPTEERRSQLKIAPEKTQFAGIADEYIGEETSAEHTKQTCLETTDEEGSEEVELLLGLLSWWIERLEQVEMEILFARWFERLERLEMEILFARWFERLETWWFERLERLVEMQQILEEVYRRFSDGIVTERSFIPKSVCTDGSGRSPRSVEISRHDIFKLSNGKKDPKRIIVSGDDTRSNTALSHILAYDWATQNRSSPLKKKGLLFELNARLFTKKQTIEAAIKRQLFHDIHEVDVDMIRKLLKNMPDGITILLDGFDVNHIGDNIMKVLTGRALQEATVMVICRQRPAEQLRHRAPGLYDLIDIQ